MYIQKILAVFRILRPQQWVKNAFVFLPLFFNGSLFDIANFTVTLSVFLSFSFAASSIYCLNDIVDIEADRAHPRKCKRPFAAGILSRNIGWAIMCSLLLLSAAIELLSGGAHSGSVLSVIAVYILLNIAYCLYLKRVAIADVFIVSMGFVLRLVAGSSATQTPLSNWIVLMTFLLALFLAFAKRRDDVLIYNETGMKVRKTVSRFNLSFLNVAIVIIASVTLVCYIMYTVSPEVILRLNSEHLYVTSVFVLLGILRYLQRILVDGASGSPTRILMEDRFIQCTIAGWIAVFCIIIYL